jgi:hypothetical protein
MALCHKIEFFAASPEGRNMMQIKALRPSVDFGGRLRKCYVAVQPNAESWTMNGSTSSRSNRLRRYFNVAQQKGFYPY